MRAEPLLRRWGRRALTLSLLLLAGGLAFLASPLLLPLGLWEALDRRRCRARAGLFLLLLLAAELGGVLAALLLWLLRAGPAAHRRLQAGWARLLLFGAARIFRLRFEVEGDAEAARGPVLVLLRHVSLADTLLPGVFLSDRHGLFLRYVLKAELLWDPCLDIVGQRLPNAFVRRDGQAEDQQAVADLARDLGPDEGLLIYPEGTRFSPARRARSLEKLAASDPRRHARALALHHSLLPRPGGVLRALETAPGLDVVIGAHVGFEGITTLRELSDGRLVGRRIHLRFQRFLARDLPTEPEARVDWLDARWAELDAWVEGRLAQG